jgi:hypothetical protein
VLPVADETPQITSAAHEPYVVADPDEPSAADR